MAAASSSPLFSLAFIFLYCFFVLCMHVPSSSSVSFSYNFSNSSTDNPCGHDIVCYQDAEFSRATSAIELTKNVLTVPINHSEGRVWYSKPVPLWNEVTGEILSFTTTFSFNITPTNLYHTCDGSPWTSHTGDGMAFFHAPWPSSGIVLANATGGADLNLFNSSNHINATGDSRVVAVEFDTFSFGDWDNSSVRSGKHYQHIGIDINSIKSVVTRVTPRPNSLTSPFTKAAVVRYDNATKMLTVDLRIGDTQC